MFCFVCCIICVLNVVNGAGYCTFSLAALHVPEVCFWLAKNGTNWNFLRCIHVLDPLLLKYCSDINEGIGTQLLFYSVIFVNIVASFIKRSFFIWSCQFLGWSCLKLQCYGTVCNWIPKLIWSQMDWFWAFLLEYGFFVWVHICMDWNLQKLLNFFWLQQIFLIVSLRGILVCSLNMPVLFSHRIL